MMKSLKKLQFTRSFLGGGNFPMAEAAGRAAQQFAPVILSAPPNLQRSVNSNLKKALAVLLVMLLLLSGCAGKREAAVTPDASTQETASQMEAVSTPEPTPESTPEPTPEPTPEQTPEPTPAPTPEPAEITPDVVDSAFVDAKEVEDVSAQEVAAMKQVTAPAIATVLTPAASGTRVEQNGEAMIDYSHMEEGYVMVQYTAATESRLKVMVKGPTTTYTYDLAKGEWAVFPLSDGNGDYQVMIYRNVTGTKYALVLSAALSVALSDEFAPFLRPNQYVNFAQGSEVVNKGAELTAGIEDPLEKVEKVYDYVVGTIHYDKEKAATVSSGYLPVLDQVLRDEKGICFDYAALMTAMLRSQLVPCKLIVGYAGETYHAWINVWTEQSGWVDGAIFFDGSVWKRMDPTFASSASQSAEILDYIGRDANYTVKYQY